MDLGTHGGVCGLATEGQRPMDLGTKVADWSTLHEICGTQHSDPVTQVDGPVMTEFLLCSVSTASRRVQRSAVESGGGGGTQSVSMTQNPRK
jgi:hypothetical protein